MANHVYGVLLDTVSVQRYIFSSNSLKENIGASQLVKDIYDLHLKEVIEQLFAPADTDFFEAWKKASHIVAIKDANVPFEIGYIGGGNALLLSRDENKAKELVKNWSMRLLVHSPGIMPASAVGRIDLDNFSHSLKGLFRLLADNKATFIAQTVIPRHGITAECSRTGYSAEVFCEKLPPDEQSYLSSVANAKILAADSAEDELRMILKDCELDTKYAFTDKLDELGQSRGEDSHIAIVHIDGNDTGTRFMEQKSLEDLRLLSKTYEEAINRVFKHMLNEVAKNIDNLTEAGVELRQSGGKTILPLRPIIIGGDDITFVSEGRIGLWLAKIFVEEYSKQKVFDGKPITACAGVAITKTKYPFYRGYKLCEELTKAAKDRRRKMNDNGTWIDFHLTYGGFSGTIEDIRAEYYKSFDGTRLTIRPYKLEDFSELLKGVSKVKGNEKTSYPRSILMKLRQVLYSSKSDQELFMKELNARGLKLPEYKPKHFLGDKVVVNSETPYLDMIEIMDFYPDFAIAGDKNEEELSD